MWRVYIALSYGAWPRPPSELLSTTCERDCLGDALDPQDDALVGAQLDFAVDRLALAIQPGCEHDLRAAQALGQDQRVRVPPEIQRHDEDLVVLVARVGQDIALCRDRGEAAHGQRRALAPEGDQPPVERE